MLSIDSYYIGKLKLSDTVTSRLKPQHSGVLG